MLSETALRTTARILLVVYFIFILEGPIHASDFDTSLDAGKSLGTSSVSDYNPINLDNTLQSKGLGTASALTPREGQAASEKGAYEGHYTSPGGMTGASSDIGDFVNGSYQTRDKFSLGEDPTYGNKCLEKDAADNCVRWSASKDVIKESYPDCETILVPIYGDPPTYSTCNGTRSAAPMDCTVRTPVRIEAETISEPCSTANIGYKPGQVYAYCQHSPYYRVYQGWRNWGDGCTGDGRRTGSTPPAGTPFKSDGLPSDSTYLGEEWSMQTCSEHQEVGGYKIYAWYSSPSSTIDRVYIDYDSPCGDLSRFTEPGSLCTLTEVEQCDPSGTICTVTLHEGIPTGTVIPSEYLTYTAAAPTSVSCGTCAEYCTMFYDVCLAWDVTCAPPVPSGCSGSCPSDATLVSIPSITAVQTGTASSGPSALNACLVEGVFHAGNSIAVAQNFYYADPRVCNSFAAPTENFTMCMDGTNISVRNAVSTGGTALTKTQQFVPTGYDLRAYGGPDVRSVLNGWYIKSKFDCFSDVNNCQPLKDTGCHLYSQKCVDPADPWCPQVEYTYQCGGTGGITGYEKTIVCAGEIRCQGSDCVDPSYKANTDFGTAAASTELMNAVRGDSSDEEIFPGKIRECQTDPEMCCNANTGGVSMGQYVALMRATYSLYSVATAGGVVASAGADMAAAIAAYNTVAQATGMTAITCTVETSAAGIVTTTIGDSVIVTAANGTMMSATVGPGMAALGAVCTAFVVVGIIVAIYVIATTVWEGIYACDAEDISTSVDLGFNICHLVGTKKEDVFMGMPTKKHNVYCCFSSILSRLVHEQGRPQIGKSWGTAESPDCSGFSYSQFALLNFTVMDLTEYMQYVQSKTTMTPEELASAMQRAKDKMDGL